MEISVQYYMVRLTVHPDFLSRSCPETCFIAKSDQDAVKDSFRHALVINRTYSLRILRVEVFDCHLGTMLEGVAQGGIDRWLYDSERLDDSILQERPDFIG
jgi:hypothetical protein